LEWAFEDGGEDGIALKDDERDSGRDRNRDEGEEGSGIALGGDGGVKL